MGTFSNARNCVPPTSHYIIKFCLMNVQWRKWTNERNFSRHSTWMESGLVPVPVNYETVITIVFPSLCFKYSRTRKQISVKMHPLRKRAAMLDEKRNNQICVPRFLMLINEKPLRLPPPPGGRMCSRQKPHFCGANQRVKRGVRWRAQIFGTQSSQAVVVGCRRNWFHLLCAPLSLGSSVRVESAKRQRVREMEERG